MNQSYELKKHSYLKEIAVSSSLAAEAINDMINVIVDYRVGICPFNVKCNVADTLVFDRRNALNDRSAELNTM